MQKLSLLIAVIAIHCLFVGCAGRGVRNADYQDHVDLIEYETGKIDVLITKRLWRGFLGPEGYMGYLPEHFRAGLRGNGPTFVNPLFEDNPPDIHCVGTISLDREHNQVIVKLRRIVSREGETERTVPHPANGIYIIQTTRKARPGAPSL